MTVIDCSHVDKTNNSKHYWLRITSKFISVPTYSFCYNEHALLFFCTECRSQKLFKVLCFRGGNWVCHHFVSVDCQNSFFMLLFICAWFYAVWYNVEYIFDFVILSKRGILGGMSWKIDIWVRLFYWCEVLM